MAADDPDEEDWMLIVKDLAIAFAVVGGIVGVIFLFTGTWPPVVVVESGSMMHEDAGYGRVGTVDPGDLIFVQSVADRNEVTSFAEARDRGGPATYGRPGEVVIFRSAQSTPVIHRAMAWVDVAEVDGELRYTVEAYGIHGEESITIQQDGLGLVDYKPHQSGFITKGDANDRSDQAAVHGGYRLFPEPVRPSQIVGKAQGEVPWLGLIKLMVAGNVCEDPSWTQIGRACAPVDLWTMFGAGIGVILAIPLAVDQTLVHLEGRDVRWPWSDRVGEDGEDLSTGEDADPPGDRDG